MPHCCFHSNVLVSFWLERKPICAGIIWHRDWNKIPLILNCQRAVAHIYKCENINFVISTSNYTYGPGNNSLFHIFLLHELCTEVSNVTCYPIVMLVVSTPVIRWWLYRKSFRSFPYLCYSFFHSGFRKRDRANWRIRTNHESSQHIFFIWRKKIFIAFASTYILSLYLMTWQLTGVVQVSGKFGVLRNIGN